MLHCRSSQLLGLLIRLLPLRKQLVSRYCFWPILSTTILESAFFNVVTYSFPCIQALVQFSDSETASTAKNALDGRSIPRYSRQLYLPLCKLAWIKKQNEFVNACVCRYLLQEHVGPCTLRITFSAHTDLTVKFQSHRSR